MRRIAKLLAIAPIVLGIAVAGCDNAQNLTSPDAQAQFARKPGPRRVLAVVGGGSGQALVGPQGGSIVVLAPGSPNDTIAILDVPAGTVKKNTSFTIDVATDYYIELTATSERATSPNDVGATGFKKGVLLYFNTSHILESGNFSVAELKANGTILPVESSVSGHWLIGTLKHFSGYIAVSD